MRTEGGRRTPDGGERATRPIGSEQSAQASQRTADRQRRAGSDQRQPAARQRQAQDARAAAHAAPQGAGRGKRGRGKADKPHKPSWVTRQANQWWNRLLGAVEQGSLHQEEMYASHRTSRDFIWNSIGMAAWGMVFPILTMVATQLVGAEDAGRFSMAFVVASLLMILANFGVRTYQISDLEEKHSFSDYQINRVLTCVAMMVVGVLYCTLRGYDSGMFMMCMGVFVYRMIDGLADVYEGRLQQKDKLYLAGVSQGLRSVAALVVFSVLLFVTRNLVVASWGMAIIAIAAVVLLTIPLAYFETPRSRKPSFSSIAQLFKLCAPLFVALFLYNVIDNMPKFVMEGMLSYDNQLYFNALYFPAMGILMSAQVIYKPLLVKMAHMWADTSKRRKFDLAIVAMMLVIVVITAIVFFVMSWIGLTVMSFLYGIDFEQFRGLAYIMIIAGGVTAGIDFLYQTVTVLRRQRDVMVVYLITFAFSLFVPMLLIGFTGLTGAVISYLIVMCILFVLLVWTYARIRLDLSRHPEKEVANRQEPTDTPERAQLPSTDAAQGDAGGQASEGDAPKERAGWFSQRLEADGSTTQEERDRLHERERAKRRERARQREEERSR